MPNFDPRAALFSQYLAPPKDMLGAEELLRQLQLVDPNAPHDVRAKLANELGFGIGSDAYKQRLEYLQHLFNSLKSMETQRAASQQESADSVWLRHPAVKALIDRISGYAYWKQPQEPAEIPAPPGGYEREDWLPPQSSSGYVQEDILPPQPPSQRGWSSLRMTPFLQR